MDQLPLMDLPTALHLIGLHLAEHGTASRATALETLASAAHDHCPGAAAALVDWNGTEIARQRAFATVARTLVAHPDRWRRTGLAARLLELGPVARAA